MRARTAYKIRRLTQAANSTGTRTPTLAEYVHEGESAAEMLARMISELATPKKEGSAT